MDEIDALLKGRTSGFPGRRAQFTLHLIEQRTLFITSQSRRALDIYLNQEAHRPASPTGVEKWQFTTLDSDAAPPIDDLERYAPQWAKLVTPVANIRAAIAHSIGQKHAFTADEVPNICAALGLNDEEVQTAFQELYDKPLSSIYAAKPDPDRLTRKEKAAKLIEADMLSTVEDELEWLTLPRGEVLFREGDEADGMFIVVHGRLRLTVKQVDGSERTLRDMGRGESIGEMAVLSDEKRSGTVYALRDSLLMKFSRDGFNRVVERYPKVLLRFTRLIMERLRAAPTDRAQHPTTIAIVPASAAVPLTDFLNELKAALSIYGEVLHLTAERLGQYMRDNALNLLQEENEPVLAWLNEQESRYPYVLYETTPDSDSWTSRCIRQADRILLVGLADADPAPGPVERDLLRQGDENFTARQELVLLHPDRNYSTSGTARWLQNRHVERHYHVSLKAGEDFQRLSRAMVGRSIGLVLGGGGARAFAHVGVLRAIQEARIPIDVIGGTSAGSIAAALYADGADYAQMREQATLLFSTFNDYTLPLVSVLAGKNFINALQKMFGDKRIEDLRRDFFCISTNLNRAESKIHRQGALYRAVRASCSLPGVFPPVIDDETGDLLLDGSVLNNVPIDIMSERCEGGSVIVIDVGNELGRRRNYQFGDSLSGWQLFASRVLPWMKGRYRTPSILGIMSRSTMLSSIGRKTANMHKAELYLNPPVGQFGTFDMKEGDKIMDIGYQYAVEQIAAWQASDSQPHAQ